ncbi:MAG TPA: hypothetical protein VID68_04115 [Solirubrobacteraceae bacterium]|jgi:hypothetical protein
MPEPGTSRLQRTAPGASALLGALALTLPFAGIPVSILIHQTSFADASNLAPWLAMGLAFGVVGLVVARREPRNPMGWLLLVVSSCLSLGNVAPAYAYLDYTLHDGRLPLGPIAVLLSQSYIYGFILLPLIVLLFPDARLPHRWRWPLRGYLLVLVVYFVGSINVAVVALGLRHPVDSGGNLVGSNTPFGAAAWFGVAMKPCYVIFFAFCLASVAYQLLGFRHSTGERRQQLKWLGAGGAIALAVLMTVMLWKSAPGIVGNVGLPIALIGVPMSIGVGILRYRLFEIDRIVSRTLAYALLTALLAGIFIGLVALTTNTLAISGRVGVAASTLAAAALFNPLRRRIQRLVDRRFNRARYNAEATVAAFTTRLREAVEIDAIRSDLVDTVRRAVEPSHVSVWIRR